MKNKLISLFLIVTLLMMLTACQIRANSSEETLPSEDTTASVPPDTAPSAPSSEEPAETKTEGLAEYRLALRQIAREHIYPDGTDTGFDGIYGAMENNRFAIYDVNGDGANELIVQFTTAPMAGNTETIYAFQKTDGALKQILTASPNLTYYSNGIVKEDWPRGSWLTGEGYWPYTLYQYNAAEGRFEELARVDMWSKAMSAVNEQGDPYPDNIDAEGAGTVFILTRQGKVETISKTDYEKWLDHTVGSATERNIPYQALSEENIEAMK